MITVVKANNSIMGVTLGAALQFLLGCNAPTTSPSLESGPNISLPSPPRSVVALPGNVQATVSWLAPTSNGGAAITGYTVTSTPHSKTCYTLGTLSCSVTGLTNGTAYTFTVKASNSAGSSQASSPSSSITPNNTSAVSVPGTPRSVTASPGNAQAIVSWLAPTSNGGATITGYTVTSTPHSKTCYTLGTLSCSVSGLTNGTTYTFTVKASNSAGTSQASSASNSVTPSSGTSGVPGSGSGSSYCGLIGLSLYAQDNAGTYLGTISFSTSSSASIMNPFGSYGSEFSSTSIMNEFSSFGSAYGSYSAYNEFASYPPMIIGFNAGNQILLYGLLTKNKFASTPSDFSGTVSKIDPDELLGFLKFGSCL
jgi:hypothetical protein